MFGGLGLSYGRLGASAGAGTGSISVSTTTSTSAAGLMFNQASNSQFLPAA